jgi:hypothetical protein
VYCFRSYLPQQAGALHRLAIHQINKHIVDGAVIAAIEHQQLLATGGGPRPAQGKAVGIGGGHGKLPVRQAKAPRQFLGHPDRIF